MPAVPARFFTFQLHEYSHYAEEKGESYPKRLQRPSDCEKSKPCHCYGWRGMRSVVTRRRRFPLLLHACFQVPVADLVPSLCPHRSRDVTFFPATRLPFFSNSFQPEWFLPRTRSKSAPSPPTPLPEGEFSFSKTARLRSVCRKKLRDAGEGRGNKYHAREDRK